MNSVMFTENCKLAYPNMDHGALCLASRAHHLHPSLTVEQFAGMAEMFAGYDNDEIADKDIQEVLNDH